MANKNKALTAAPDGYVYPTKNDRAQWSEMSKEAKRLGFREMAAELLAASKKPARFSIRRDVKATYAKFYRDLKAVA